MTSEKTTFDISSCVDKPEPIVISFDVKIGAKSYQSVFDRIMNRLAKELRKKRKPGYIFTKGEIILAFYDGHDGVTPKMLKYIDQLRGDAQEQLSVELPGWGISALHRHIRGNVIRVYLQCWLIHEHYIFPINRWDDYRVDPWA